MLADPAGEFTKVGEITMQNFVHIDSRIFTVHACVHKSFGFKPNPRNYVV